MSKTDRVLSIPGLSVYKQVLLLFSILYSKRQHNFHFKSSIFASSDLHSSSMGFRNLLYDQQTQDRVAALLYLYRTPCSEAHDSAFRFLHRKRPSRHPQQRSRNIHLFFPQLSLSVAIFLSPALLPQLSLPGILAVRQTPIYKPCIRLHYGSYCSGSGSRPPAL